MLVRNKQEDEMGSYCLKYMLSGRVRDVVHALDGGAATGSDHVSFSEWDHVRAIAAIGRTAPDTRTPLMHHAGDRTALWLGELLPENSVSSSFTSSSTLSIVLATLVARFFTALLLEA